jgi:hypothetical protein
MINQGSQIIKLLGINYLDIINVRIKSMEYNYQLFEEDDDTILLLILFLFSALYLSQFLLFAINFSIG